MKIDQVNNRISLPNQGWVSYRNSREVVDELKNVTVSQSCGKWFVSILKEYEVADLVHKAESIVGLDAVVTKFATLSDGTVYQPVKGSEPDGRRSVAPVRPPAKALAGSASRRIMPCLLRRVFPPVAADPGTPGHEYPCAAAGCRYSCLDDHFCVSVAVGGYTEGVLADIAARSAFLPGDMTAGDFLGILTPGCKAQRRCGGFLLISSWSFHPFESFLRG